MIRSEIEKLESQSGVSESLMPSALQKDSRAIPVMDVVDRLRLNLFKIERLQSKLSLALGEVSQIVTKK